MTHAESIPNGRAVENKRTASFKGNVTDGHGPATLRLKDLIIPHVQVKLWFVLTATAMGLFVYCITSRAACARIAKTNVKFAVSIKGSVKWPVIYHW